MSILTDRETLATRHIPLMRNLIQPDGDQSLLNIGPILTDAMRVTVTGMIEAEPRAAKVFRPNPSGLSWRQRAKARTMALDAAVLGLNHKAELHYTQGPLRWEGILYHRKAWRGEFPRYADCSAFVTWALWNGLDHFGVNDVVNGDHWRGGFTGTLLTHGVRVDGRYPLHVCDVAIYGNGYPGKHTALYIGGGYVISNGSEGAPYKLPLHYRPDLMQIRRYI